MVSARTERKRGEGKEGERKGGPGKVEAGLRRQERERRVNGE